jgi:pantothenate kinase
MAQVIDFNRLLELARELLARPDRQVLAIAGAPGSGKSTLVERLFTSLAGEAVAILPMDGFHYDDAVLHAMERRPWKGAPDTFDVGGLRSTLVRLRDPDEGAVAVPVFDRDLEISRGSARIIGPEVRLILAEGNYLLLDSEPWHSLRRQFDATVMVDVPEQELKQRLRQRWQGYGLSAEQIDFKLEQNDLPNGRLVAQSSSGSDFVLG